MNTRLTNLLLGDDPAESFPAVAAMAARFIAQRGQGPVAAGKDKEAIRARLADYHFENPRPVVDVAADLFDLLGLHAVRNDHPRYFGLFNPPPLPAAVLGDLITATVNPQLAVWEHAPAATEIERRLIELFGARIGLPEDEIAGTFTSGGSEANLTALMAALARAYPDWPEKGLACTERRPGIYVSAESHLAWIKIARMAGLGSEAVRLVPADNGLAVSGERLADFITFDRRFDPVLVAATAGTTAHGAIDDLTGCAAVARGLDIHFHVDAAWAGGVLLSERSRHLLAGIELADSVTLDPHKWLCVPMAAGMYLARDWRLLETSFKVTAGYMPSASRADRDSYIHSAQWSRRFIGLKLFTALASLGRSGYEALIEHMMTIGDYLRNRLEACGWRIQNESHLPLVCFVPDGIAFDEVRIRAIAQEVTESGAAWISTTPLRGRQVLRACITSYETSQPDVDRLIVALNDARAIVEKKEYPLPEVHQWPI